MGEVYRARHSVLDRVVAIKTVNADHHDPSAARRLMREARHASRLSHPNICAIYEVGTSDERPFIVMQHIDGRPLREMVQAGGIDLSQTLGIGVQVAEALAYAHDQGIIHRDLKSSNVVVDATGRAIVLDFGLAKRLSASSDTGSVEASLTAQGALAGTLSHMAPEVLLGGEADARSDVWALGVLLYELVNGTLPFTGRTPYEVSSAILSGAASPLDSRTPLALRLVIERCLLKDPQARYQSARDVRAALDAIRRRRAWPVVGRLLVTVRRRTLLVVGAALALAPALALTGRYVVSRLGQSPVRVSAIAILPFRDANGNRDETHYADGFSEALTAQLGALTEARIIGPVSAARVVRVATRPEAIGRSLGANILLDGSLRRAPDRVVVDLRLVEAESGRVLWSDTYDRNATEVLALQADVARALALALRLAVRPAAQERFATVRAVRPDVYEAYLAGRYEWNQRTAESLQRAIAHYSRAVELDPTYAPAHAALADCFNQLGTVMVGSSSPQAMRPRAAAEAIKALQLDPNSAEAHAALGYVRHYQLRWSEAEHEFRRAIELNPNYSMARIWYANFLMSRRRFDESLRQVFIARDLEPFSLIVNTNVAWVLGNAGRHDEAIAQLQRTLSLDSTYVQAHMRLAGAFDGAGRYDSALAHAHRLVSVMHGASPSLALLGPIQAHAGDTGAARATLRELLERSRTEFVPAWSIASIYAALADVDSAVVWAERAFAEQSNVVAYFNVDGNTPALRRDPRFRALLVRAGLE
jgi:serine/threonine-protein kinase